MHNIKKEVFSKYVCNSLFISYAQIISSPTYFAITSLLCCMDIFIQFLFIIYHISKYKWPLKLASI